VIAPFPTAFLSKDLGEILEILGMFLFCFLLGAHSETNRDWINCKRVPTGEIRQPFNWFVSGEWPVTGDSDWFIGQRFFLDWFKSSLNGHPIIWNGHHPLGINSRMLIGRNATSWRCNWWLNSINGTYPTIRTGVGAVASSTFLARVIPLLRRTE